MISNFPLSVCISPSLPLRRSGTDWQDTLSLIRQMAWGETLIWTSSAWKRTVLPGWAQRGREQPITTHSCCRHTAWFFPLKCVCVCVWTLSLLVHLIHPCIHYCFFLLLLFLLLQQLIYFSFPHCLSASHEIAISKRCHRGQESPQQKVD